MPKELAAVSMIEDYPGDPHQFYDAQENCGEEVHRAPITEEVKEFSEIGTADSLDSKMSETSYFQSQMHLDDSVELTSLLYAKKSSGKPDAMVVQEREVGAQHTPAGREESLKSHSSECQKALGETRFIVFI